MLVGTHIQGGRERGSVAPLRAAAHSADGGATKERAGTVRVWCGYGAGTVRAMGMARGATGGMRVVPRHIVQLHRRSPPCKCKHLSGVVNMAVTMAQVA